MGVVDQAVLDMLFSTHKELWSDFGIYEAISKNQGADAEGLAANRVFLKKLLHVQPSAVLLLTQVRQSVLRVLAAEPTLNKTNLKNLVYASSRFDRLSAMFYHLRRAKRDEPKMRQLVAKATGDSLKAVTELIDMIQLDDDPVEDLHPNCRAKTSMDPAAAAPESSGQLRAVAAGKAPVTEKLADQPKPAVEKLPKKRELPDQPKPAAQKGSKQQKLNGQPKPAAEKASEKLKHGKPKPATVVEKKTKPAFKYLKEYYKADGTFGVKKFSGSGAERQCHGQIFSFGHRSLKRSQIEPLAVKVLLDLHRYAGQTNKEDEIKVIAQHKISKMLIRK